MSQLRLRQGTYEDALVAFDAGDFSFCAESLRSSATPESQILRTRALVRIGNLEAAFSTIDACAQDCVRHETAAEILALKIYVLNALRRTQEAEDLCVEANARCFSSGFVALEAEIIFGRVIGAVSTGDYEKAEQAIHTILALQDDQPAWLSPRSYRYPLSYWRARALDARGAIAFARGNHSLQAEYLRAALSEFDSAAVSDDYIQASLLANYVDAAIHGERSDVIELALERGRTDCVVHRNRQARVPHFFGHC